MHTYRPLWVQGDPSSSMAQFVHPCLKCISTASAVTYYAYQVTVRATDGSNNAATHIFEDPGTTGLPASMLLFACLICLHPQPATQFEDALQLHPQLGAWPTVQIGSIISITQFEPSCPGHPLGAVLN